MIRELAQLDADLARSEEKLNSASSNPQVYESAASEVNLIASAYQRKVAGFAKKNSSMTASTWVYFFLAVTLGILCGFRIDLTSAFAPRLSLSESHAFLHLYPHSFENVKDDVSRDFTQVSTEAFPLSFQSDVLIDYFPLNQSARAFSVKRLVFTFASQRAPKPLEWNLSSVTSACLNHIEQDFERTWRRGLLRFEIGIFALGHESFAKWQNDFSLYTERLRAINSKCQFSMIDSAVVPRQAFDSASFSLTIAAFKCDHDFFSIPPALLGSATCITEATRNCNDAGPHIPGFTSDEERLRELESPNNEILREATLRGAGEAISGPISKDLCMDLNAANNTHAVEQVLVGPNFYALPWNATVHIANIDQPLFIIDNFISDEENDHVLAHGRDKLHQSTILGMTSKSNDRTSFSSYFASSATPIIARIERRAREFSRFSHLEGLQIVRYQQGQKYSQHTDWFFGKGSAAAIGRDGQRAATIFVYLNDVTVEDGGETDFPKVNALKVRPRKNSAVFWYNVLPNGKENPNAVHAGLPLGGYGEKYGLNIWMRDNRLVGKLQDCKPWHIEYADRL